MQPNCGECLESFRDELWPRKGLKILPVQQTMYFSVASGIQKFKQGMKLTTHVQRESIIHLFIFHCTSNPGIVSHTNSADAIVGHRRHLSCTSRSMPGEERDNYWGVFIANFISLEGQFTPWRSTLVRINTYVYTHRWCICLTMIACERMCSPVRRGRAVDRDKTNWRRQVLGFEFFKQIQIPRCPKENTQPMSEDHRRLSKAF